MLAPYHIALADFLNLPSVMHLDLSGLTAGLGKPIRVPAHDDFEVVAVSVSVLTVQRGAWNRARRSGM